MIPTRFHVHRRLFTLAWIATIAIYSTRHLRAQEAPPPATQPGVEVKEWLVMISAPNQPHANAPSAVIGSLPDSLDPLRFAPEGEKTIEPSPIGVIRFIGQSEPTFSLRLTTPDDGLCYTSWPLARVRSPNIIWPDLTISQTPQRPLAGHELQWLEPLRDSKGQYLTTAGRSEKFLLYDAEFPFFLPLTLEYAIGGTGPIRVRNRGDSILHDIVLYRPPQKDTPWSTAQFSEIPSRSETRLTATAPALPADAQFAPVGGDPAKTLADQWKSRLAEWELPPADVDLIVEILKRYALDDRQTTAVFRLDDTEINRVLPMQITPRPARVRRLALVVARNIDPDLPEIIDALVVQLGDSDWHKREAANKALARFGQSANKRLREALQSTDPEIALRAALLAHNALR